MPRTVYNKLVRDKIPDIIAEKGQASRTRLLSESEYRDYLRLKLQEEMKEFLESNDIEELADLVEVIRAMLKVDMAARGMRWRRSVWLNAQSVEGSMSGSVWNLSAVANASLSPA